ncbi:MAG TPA: ribosome biogenesis GTP-binding protein YihA/YsxC [Hyphomicrobiales bacterium]|nr:ribosome biogenesis GTP-binding protein YihA/YsxC [Hyphomicrobiales bacterium]
MSEADDRPDDAALAEAGRLLFARESVFLRGAVKLDQLPPMEGPEIAFAGRSNVGKSSLVNALAGRRMLAKVSNTPGRTQELNFFRIGGVLTLVDMPGYGFAQAPEAKVKAWTRLALGYLEGRTSLARVFLLIDARHGLKKTDVPVLDRLDRAAVSYQVVLTKADQLKPAEAEARHAEVAAALARRPAAYPEVLLTSGRTGAGVPDLRAAIARLLAERGALSPGCAN